MVEEPKEDSVLEESVDEIMQVEAVQPASESEEEMNETIKVDQDQELYADELIQEIEDLRESYRLLQEQFDNVNTSRLGKAISDKSIDNILKHTVSHTEFELQKENDFLHMRL